MAEEQTFIKKLVFRFIRKHIAGATLNSALDVTKELNSKGIKTTITFLNDHTYDNVKARYNLNSYIHLVKQVSRLNLNSSVSVRLTQLGFNEDTADRSMHELIDVAKSLGICLWIEYENSIDMKNLMQSYATYKKEYSNIGIELPLKSDGLDKMLSMLPKKDMMVKLTTHSYEVEGKKKAKASNPISLYVSYAKRLDKINKLYILENDEKALYKIASDGSVPKKNLIIQLPLGYSRKWLKRFEKKKLNIDVYVPYGKDWIPYAINKLTEGRIRNIATSILNGESEVVFHGKK